jgi:heterotetrameric sarcosine oxidase gamma subunit
MKQSPLAQVHQEVGALFSDRDGWTMPVRYGREPEQEVAQARISVGLADWSWSTKLDLKGPGVPRLSDGGPFRLWNLGARHALLTGEPRSRESLETWLGVWRRPEFYLTDVTGVYADLLVIGPRGRDVLRKLTSLDVSERSLPDGEAGQTSLAHTHCLILREDRANLPAYHLLVARDYGESTWEALLEAAGEFTSALLGLEAMGLLG